MVRSSYKWNIGTGNDIPVWEHRWVYDGSVLTKPMHLNSTLPDMTVSDLLVLNEKRWNTALIRTAFYDSSAEKSCTLL
jgi:hypothetical protein